MQHLNYGWRVLATGFCFVCFGLGGLALTLLVFPFLFALPQHQRTPLARRIISRSFRVFLRLMVFVRMMYFEIEGQHKLKNSQCTLVLANHPTLVDVVALISLLPSASCVVKQALWNNPFLKGVVRAADYISNSEPEQLLQDCAADLAKGCPLVIFPEGTRTPARAQNNNSPTRLKFLRGAAYIAVQSGLPNLTIQPILIQCTPPTLMRGLPWYQVPSRRFCLRIKVLDAVAVPSFKDVSPALAARRLTHIWEDFFTQQLINFDSQ
jgi:1-acyl-sn-glycerol-3-phosphate acyltransferase